MGMNCQESLTVLAKRPRMLSMSKKREVKELVRELEDKGWRVIIAQNNHHKAFHPDGEHMIVFANTPSDHRAIKNIRAMVKRIEREIEQNEDPQV